MTARTWARALRTVFVSSLAAGSAAVAQQPAGYELVLVDLQGMKQVVGVLPPSVFAPRVAPDGERVAFELADSANGPTARRVFVAPLDDLAARRALPMVGNAQNWAPFWTLDGERLVFLVTGDRPDSIYWRNADGTGDAEHLIDARSVEDWSRDGSKLTFLTLVGNGDYGISLLDVTARTVKKIIDLPGSAEHSSNVSPDGRWIAFATNETGEFEVWIAPFGRSGERHRVTHGGGGHPLWSADGRTIYFDNENRLYEVHVRLDRETPTFGEPVALPIAGFAQGLYRRQFDLMPDGQRFVMLFPVASDASR